MNETTTKIFPYLERLLDGEEVEWKTLGEVAEFKRGQTIMKKTAQTGVYPVISGGQQPAYYIDQYNRTGQTITVAGSGAYAGFVMFWDEPIFVSDAFSIKTDEEVVLPRYVFHFLLNKQSSIFNLKRGAGVPHVYAKDLAAFSIPIPPLRVQARIVEILDKFTQLEAQLEAELQAELEARRKQYAYYRDQLLNFSQYPPLNVNIEWKALGEVCVHLRTGLNPRKNFKLNTEDASNYYVTVRELGGTELLYSEKTDLINDDALQLINNRSKLKVNDILFSGTGTIGKTAFISKEPTNWNIKEGVYALTLNTHYVLPMFVLRYLQTQSTIDWIDRMAAGGIVRSITMKNLEQLPIPIPPLSEQRRIVDILDRFDTLTNSISEGLPKEIALRRKQYAYYRDALLSFPRPEVSA